MPLSPTRSLTPLTSSRTDSLSPVPEEEVIVVKDQQKQKLLEEKANLAKKMQILEEEFNTIRGSYLDAKERELEEERLMVLAGTHPSIMEGLHEIGEKERRKIHMVRIHHEFQKANAINIHDCGVKQAKDTYAMECSSIKWKHLDIIRQKQFKMVLEEAKLLSPEDAQYLNTLRRPVSAKTKIKGNLQLPEICPALSADEVENDFFRLKSLERESLREGEDYGGSYLTFSAQPDTPQIVRPVST